VVGQDGETALLVPPGDVPALARGLLRLLGDSDLRDRLQRAARERALERYSWTATAEQSVAQYREVLHMENGLRLARAAVAGTPAC
jgi:glycosyltransferase involved in cell wall biosynthesis